eukprot:6175390-Pleurochrysis_carterae.AAC.1
MCARAGVCARAGCVCACGCACACWVCARAWVCACMRGLSHAREAVGLCASTRAWQEYARAEADAVQIGRAQIDREADAVHIHRQAEAEASELRRRDERWRSAQISHSTLDATVGCAALG